MFAVAQLLIKIIELTPFVFVVPDGIKPNVVEDAVGVTVPAPSWITSQRKVVPNPLGTVSAMFEPLVQCIERNRSREVKVYAAEMEVSE